MVSMKTLVREDSCKANSLAGYKKIKSAIEELERSLNGVKSEGATDPEYEAFSEMFNQLDKHHTRMTNLTTNTEEDISTEDDE